MADFDEVLDLRAYLREQESSAAGLGLTEAVVEAVEQLGMGDRCCVDLCSALHPGEGLLVGSFSSSLARNFAYWQHVVGHLR